jgi:hypothetical protein
VEMGLVAVMMLQVCSGRSWIRRLMSFVSA